MMLFWILGILFLGGVGGLLAFFALVLLRSFGDMKKAKEAALGENAGLRAAVKALQTKLDSPQGKYVNINLSDSGAVHIASIILENVKLMLDSRDGKAN